MRIRTRKNLRKKNLVIVFLFLLPLIVFLSYAGFLLYILHDISSYTLELSPPKTSYFYDLDDINDSILEELANRYDYQMEKFHMPTNISVNLKFKDYTYNEVDLWYDTDNGALSIGYTIVSQCLRYKVALENNDSNELLNATRMVRKSVSAFSNMMAATNWRINISALI